MHTLTKMMVCRQGNGPAADRTVNSGHIVLDDVNVPPGVHGANDTAAFRSYCLNPGVLPKPCLRPPCIA